MPQGLCFQEPRWLFLLLRVPTPKCTYFPRGGVLLSLVIHSYSIPAPRLQLWKCSQLRREHCSWPRFPAGVSTPPIRDARAGRVRLAQGCGVRLFQEVLPAPGGPMQLQLHESVLVSLPSPTSLVFPSWGWWCSGRHDLRPELLRGSSSSHSNHLGQEENPILRPHGTIFSEEECSGSVCVHFSIET